MCKQMVQTDLGVRHTTIVARLRVGLVLAVTVAAGGAATHLGSRNEKQM